MGYGWEKSLGIQGHAMAESPTALAHTLLYIVRGSPFFFLRRSTSHSSIPFIREERTIKLLWDISLLKSCRGAEKRNRL